MNRVKELLEAASVLSGAGDRAGALRLCDEALRLAPNDPKATALRAKLAPDAAAVPLPQAASANPTPFAPPPVDLFADAQPKTTATNPFVRPPQPRTAGTPAASALGSGIPVDPGQHLGDLLRSASASLTPGAPPAAMDLPPGRAPMVTDPYASRPGAPSGALDALNAAPNGETLPFAGRPRAGLQAGTLLTGGPSRPASSPDNARTGTMLAGESQVARPGSSPGSARTGTLMAGAATGSLESMLSDALAQPAPRTPGKGSRPVSRSQKPRPTSDKAKKARPVSDSSRPSTKSKAARPISAKRPKSRASENVARPRSSAPYDPMELIDEPPTPGHASAIDQMLRQARELLEFADHSGALERVEQVLEQAPMNADALALKARCEATLTSMFESKLGDLRKKPKLKLRPDEVIWLNLDHRAGFVLAQIDGQLTLEDLFDLSGMSRLDTARILAQLMEEKVIAV